MINKEKKIKIINLSNRKSYTNAEYDITIIQLKDDDDIDNFLELDDNILNNILENDNNKNNYNHIYLKETIYILQYPEGKLSVSYGLLDNILEDKRYNFNHSCSTKTGSSGSPIINLSNKKVIGIHKEGMKGINYNRGTFLNYPIREFINGNVKTKKKQANKSKDIKINNLDKKLNNNHIIDVIEKNIETIPLKKQL